MPPVFAGRRGFEMIGQEIDHALIQVAHHVGDLLMLAFEIFSFNRIEREVPIFGPEIVSLSKT